jgi:hypothetical protein
VTQSIYREVAEYQSILSFFFRDCEGLTPVDKILLTEEAIAKEIYAYNSRCGTMRPVATEQVKIIFNDSTEDQLAIDTREFFKSKILLAKDNRKLPAIETVRSVSIGPTTYYVKQFEGETKIVEQLVSGSINLYRIAAVSDETGLYAEKGTFFKQLRVYQKGSQNVREYGSILSFMFRDCQDSGINVDRIKFREQAIANAIHTYNTKCGYSSEAVQPSQNSLTPAENLPTEQQPSQVKTEFALVGGIALASMSVTNSGRYGFVSSFKMPLNRPFVGASFRIGMAKLSGLGLKQSLTFEKIKNNSVLQTSYGSGLYRQTLTYDFTELRYGLIVDYLIRTRGPFAFGLGIGATFNFELKNNSSVSTTYYSDVNGVLKEYSRRQVAYEGDSKDVRFSPVGELKIRYKRFEIVYQHLTMAHYQNDNGPSARENRIFLSWRITR